MVAPWQVDDVPYEWRVMFQTMGKYIEQRNTRLIGKQVSRNFFAKSRAKHPTYRKYRH